MKKAWQEALKQGDALALGQMLDAGEDIDALDRYGQTSLMLAALHGKLDVVRLLVERGANLNHSAKYHLTALMLAVINDRAQIVDILLQAGADVTLRGSGAPGFFNKTAFDLAKDLKRDDIMTRLCENAQ